MPKSSLDPDAKLFIAAAGITDATQVNAINTLVVSLKVYSIWTKFKAIYPIVGGTASSHAVNLKTPGTFNLTYGTGVTHSSTGMVGNGTSGYADTNLTPSTVLTLNSTHYGYYSRTDNNSTQVDLGGLSGSLQNFMQIRNANVATFSVHQTAPYTSFANTNSQGFYLANRTASNVFNGWKNGAKVVTTANLSTGLLGINLYLLAYNLNGAAALYSTRQCAFASIGDGLTDTDAANFYTAVQAFQTTLGRQV
jgi:hypothetical protein